MALLQTWKLRDVKKLKKLDFTLKIILITFCFKTYNYYAQISKLALN